MKRVVVFVFLGIGECGQISECTVSRSRSDNEIAFGRFDYGVHYTEAWQEAAISLSVRLDKLKTVTLLRMEWED